MSTVEKQGDPPGDLALVQAVLNGDSDAIDQLAKRLTCVPRMLASQNRRMGRPLDEHTISDLGQDVLVAVWERLDRFRGTCTLETWSWAFSQNIFRNAIRKRGRRGPELSMDSQVEEPAHESELPPEVAYDYLYGCMAGLEPEAAELICRKHFEGSTFATMADSMGESINTLKSRYYRAFERLRQCLEPYLRGEIE